MEFMGLNDLIKLIIGGDAFHICIHDMAGILKNSLSIDMQYQTHTKPFCATAKANSKGFDTCTKCKKSAISKAVLDTNMFSGYCVYGLYEIVKPVIINGKTQCVIFVGNLICDYATLLGRVFKTCKETTINETKLLSAIPKCQVMDTNQRYISVAVLLDSYIRLIYEYNKAQGSAGVDGNQTHHWVVSNLKNYIETNYTDNISLKIASNLYHMDRKYMGRLFSSQIGRTFHEYLNDVRLEKAIGLLLNTDENIINIALDCGFQNVTYFNRIFLKRYNMSPSAYRKKFSTHFET